MIVTEQLTRHNPLIHLRYCCSWREIQVLILQCCGYFCDTDRQLSSAKIDFRANEGAHNDGDLPVIGGQPFIWHNISPLAFYSQHRHFCRIGKYSSMHSFLSPLLHLIIFSCIQHLCVCACVRAFDCPFAQHEPSPQPPPAAAALVLNASLDIAML